MWDPEQRLVTIREAAVSIGRPESTIRRWICERRLIPFARQGRRPLLLESDVLQVDADTLRPQPGTVTGP